MSWGGREEVDEKIDGLRTWISSEFTQLLPGQKLSREQIAKTLEISEPVLDHYLTGRIPSNGRDKLTTLLNVLRAPDANKNLILYINDQLEEAVREGGVFNLGVDIKPPSVPVERQPT